MRNSLLSSRIIFGLRQERKILSRIHRLPSPLPSNLSVNLTFASQARGFLRLPLQSCAFENGFRRYSHSARQSEDGRGLSSPAADLFRLHSLIEALGLTNSKVEKEKILQEYGDLKELLFFLFDSHVRMHVRPHSLNKYILKLQQDEGELESSPTHTIEETGISLLELFGRLNRRERTGNDALRFLASYLIAHRILAITDEQRGKGVSLTLFDVFCRCLDRNFKAGVNEIIVRSAFSRNSAEQMTNFDERSIGSFGVALGRPIDEENLDSLFKRETGVELTDEKTWYVSRKLDGVRCVIQVDLERLKSTRDKEDGAGEWHVCDIQTFSRRGNPFTSLGVLAHYLSSQLEGSKVIDALLRRAKEAGQRLGRVQDLDGDWETASLFLDGEVCMLVPAPVNLTEIGAADDGLPIVEDFQAIVGPIKRKDYTVENPAYFPFDLLTFSEFYQWRTEWEKHDPFHIRCTRVRQLVEECSSQAANNGYLQVARHLEQKAVHSTEEVKEWMLLAAKRGWEGLILRQAGRYEGKRSSSIRKVKQFREDEYTVEDVELAEMRLPVGQQYAQRMALASAVVVHKGTRVHIGSGFTAEQRIRFAEHPESLIGKQITVSYFGESRSADRAGKDEVSLRFPHVKAIWEHGPRDI